MKAKKHHFEAVSLLTPKKGMLNISIIPALGQPNWLVPTALILQVIGVQERMWTYHWQHGKGSQDIPVYPLVPKDISVDKVIILEGNSDAHRLALQTTGQIQTMDVKISDVKDVSLDEEEQAIIKNSLPSNLSAKSNNNYVHQAVSIHDEVFIVPDLDLIAQHLVDLDD